MEIIIIMLYSITCNSSHNLMMTGLIHDEQIPIKLISESKGLIFVTTVKAGLFIAPQED